MPFFFIVVAFIMMQGSWLEQSNSCPVCRAEAVHDAPPQYQQTGDSDGSDAHTVAADDTMQCTQVLGLFLTICTVGVYICVLTVSVLRDETGAHAFFNGPHIAAVLAFATIGECVCVCGGWRCRCSVSSGPAQWAPAVWTSSPPRVPFPLQP